MELYGLLVISIAMVTLSTADDGWLLTWSDEFDSLDYNKWQHEITAWGGGVRLLYI